MGAVSRRAALLQRPAGPNVAHAPTRRIRVPQLLLDARRALLLRRGHERTTELRVGHHAEPWPGGARAARGGWGGVGGGHWGVRTSRVTFCVRVCLRVCVIRARARALVCACACVGAGIRPEGVRVQGGGAGYDAIHRAVWACGQRLAHLRHAILLRRGERGCSCARVLCVLVWVWGHAGAPGAQEFLMRGSRRLSGVRTISYLSVFTILQARARMCVCVCVCVVGR